MRWLLIFVIGIHGMIHLMGFAKAFNLAELSQLTQPISRVSGFLWLLTAVLFFASVGLLSLYRNYWLIIAVAIVLSQILIFRSWVDAKYGTILNLVLLIPVIVGFLNILPSSYVNTYKREVQKALSRYHEMPLLADSDIEHLPEPVQKYLRYVGAVGQPRVQNCRAVFTGQLKNGLKANWMEIRSEQYNFFDEPTRLFYIESSLFGLPFDGLHAYVGGSATMQIRIAGILQIVDAKGEEMTRGETVTMFNDMCLLAPASLIDTHIQWQTIDALKVRAKFTNQGNTITAILYFNENDELVNFTSDDRYLSSDGKTYLNYRWSTPVKGYKDVGWRKIPAYGEAVWDTTDGPFVYGKFDVREIEYNVKK